MRLNTKKPEHAKLHANIQEKLAFIESEYNTGDNRVNPLIILLDILISHYDNNPPTITKDKRSKGITINQIKELLKQEFDERFKQITTGERVGDIQEDIDRAWDETLLDDDILSSFLDE